MKGQTIVSVLLAALLVTGANADSRKLLQTGPVVYAGQPPTLTVNATNPIVNAIAITLAIPYPQAKYYCNVTGDSRLPQQGPFPITVRVPVGVQATVVFANITGPIPGTACTAVAQPGSSVVQQPSSVVQQSTSIQQMVQNPSMVMQQAASGASVVQQQYAASVNQQMANPSGYFNCVGNVSTVVQQQGSTSVVQQPGATSVVQQPGSTSVVQQPGATSVVQQPGATSVVQQPGATSVVQQPSTTTRPATTVVQQQPSTTTRPATPSTVVQQQATPSTVVQQQATPSSVVQQSGRHLLQVGTIEYISNNGSTGQPQLSVLDTVEGVPNISFKPDKVGQTAVFNGALQVAVTTTNDGFGTPFIPYRVDSRLSPQCGLQVNFVGV